MSKYHPKYSVEPILTAAHRWADRCLISDSSVFTDENLWTANHFDELDRVYVRNPLEEGSKNFLEKLEEQLDPAAPAARRLMAEVLWILMLFPARILPATKRETICAVWSWSGTQLDRKHDSLSDEVLRGIGATGAAYNTQRWREVAFVVGLARTLKRNNPDERESLVKHPWQFTAWMDQIPESRNRQFRNILAYLLFPEHFERISTSKDKRAIVSAFASLPKQEVAKLDKLDIDRRLLEIRGGAGKGEQRPGRLLRRWSRREVEWIKSELALKLEP